MNDVRQRRYARTSTRYRARVSRRKPVFARRRRIPRWAIACFFACVAFVVGASMVGGAMSSASAGGEASPSRSTPVSEWAKGSIPYLYQTDPAWASEPYAGGTVEENGCGPTCLSMVYIALTGRTDLDPAAMAAFSEAGGYVDSGMTSWTFMTDGAQRLGLASEELPADASSVASALAQGRPVICSVGPGDFTSSGHFIVLAGEDESGKIVVRDPNSEERSHQAWDIDRILSQCRNLWAFSVA